MIIRIFLTTIYLSSVALALDPSVECIQSVCGTQPKVSGYNVTATQFLAAQKVVEPSLKKPVTNYIGRVIHEALVTNQAFQDLLAMKEFPKIDSKFSGLLNAFLCLQRLPDYMSAAELDAQNKYVINPDKLKQQNPSLTGQEQEAILSFNSGLDALIRGNGYFKYIFPVALKLKYGNEITVRSAEIQIAQEISSTEERMINLFPSLKNYLGFNPALKKSLSGETLTEAEQVAMVDSYKTTLALQFISNENVLEKFQKLPLDLNFAQANAQRKFQVSNIKYVFENRPSIKGLYQESYKRCMTYLNYSYAALPTKQQIAKFKDLLPAVENQAKLLLEERKKASIGSAMNIEYQYPLAQEDFIANIHQLFDTKRIDLDTSLKTKIDLNSQEGFQIGLFLTLSYTEKEFLEKAVSLCEQIIPSSLDDISFQTIGVIKVSRSSILFPEIGIPVIAHELGHQVWAKFPQDISAEASCLKAAQSTSQYASEDFADLFSAAVVKGLGNSLSTSPLENIGCAVAMSNQQGFINDQLRNVDATATHSSGLYRLLAFSAMTVTPTVQCKKFLKESSETRFDNYCRWKQ